MALATIFFYVGSHQFCGGVEMLMSSQMKLHKESEQLVRNLKEPQIKNESLKMYIDENLKTIGKYFLNIFIMKFFY